MGDINMATVNARISEAVHAGRLDPDQVPANLEDIKAYTAAEKTAFFAAIYPDDIIDALASGTQLPAADLELMRYMPLSVVQTLPDQLQDAIILNTPFQAALNSMQATINDSIKPFQATLDSLQATLNDTIKDICKEAGITLDQYKALIRLLNKDIQQNPQRYAGLELYGDLSDLAKALRALNASQTKPIMPDKVLFPIDIINQMITTLEGDQVRLGVKGKNKNSPIIYLSIAYESQNVLIPKYITHYDKLINAAIAALYRNGYTEITATLIHNVIAKGNPSKEQLQKIMHSVEKQMTAKIEIDNRDEIKHKFGYDLFYKKQNMLYAKIEGRLQKGLVYEVIQILDMPILIQFAEGRKQCFNVPCAYLQAGSKTEKTVPLNIYLLFRIENAKPTTGNKKMLSRKVLYKTIYEEIGRKPRDAKDVSRIKIHIYRFLTYLKDNNHIKGFRMLDDGIMLQVTDSHVEDDNKDYPKATYDEVRYKDEIENKKNKKNKKH